MNPNTTYKVLIPEQPPQNSNLYADATGKDKTMYWGDRPCGRGHWWIPVPEYTEGNVLAVKFDDIDGKWYYIVEKKSWLGNLKNSIRLAIAKKRIPHGMYCYSGNRNCPYWDLRDDMPMQQNGYCHFLKKGDWEIGGEKLFMNVETGEMQVGETMSFGSLLWDQCKECGINEDYEDDGLDQAYK